MSRHIRHSWRRTLQRHEPVVANAAVRGAANRLDIGVVGSKARAGIGVDDVGGDENLGLDATDEKDAAAVAPAPTPAPAPAVPGEDGDAAAVAPAAVPPPEEYALRAALRGGGDANESKFAAAAASAPLPDAALPGVPPDTSLPGVPRRRFSHGTVRCTSTVWGGLANEGVETPERSVVLTGVDNRARA